ncbi:hypothetical protein [Streptomyces sp. NPDC017988]|uniref:hypothetical protein n=1 Tax=Streptomyces sp. NPDC017988 TaxID=3365025 RepID=UPI00379AB03F
MYDYPDAEKDPTIAGRHLNWIRAFYEDVYHTTGGVPTVAASTSAHTDGRYVNYPDTDLDDPVRNTSGQPAHLLYYVEVVRPRRGQASERGRCCRRPSAGLTEGCERHLNRATERATGGRVRCDGSAPTPARKHLIRMRTAHTAEEDPGVSDATPVLSGLKHRLSWI